MQKQSLTALVKENSYPGRGIVLGRSEDAQWGVIAYFIMGRSDNSRNRVFCETADGIITQAFDPAKLVDPSLIIYAPVRKLNDKLIVTNGDQTDTVYDYLKQGEAFEAALRTRTFEPDAPNFTPRISGLMERSEVGISYRLSILKSDHGDGESAIRFFFEYENSKPGEGHFIHTYRCDGNPIPSFEGEPVPVSIGGNIDSFASALWESLNEDNKVSLFVRYWNIKTGEEKTRILNKLEK